MGTPHVVAAENEQNVYQKLCTILLARVLEKPDLVLSVFSGTPVFGVYQALVARAGQEHVDFSHVRFVVLDELATPDGSAPFHGTLVRLLFEPLGIPPENVIWFDPRAEAAREVARISSWIAAIGIDVALLSADARGHIGFHTAGAEQDSRTGMLAVENVRRWKTNRAFSLGLRDLMAADTILLFAAGSPSANIIRDIVEGGVDPARPVSALGSHRRVLLVADKDALSALEKPEAIAGYYAGLYILDSTNLPAGRSILVISPHPDDAAISVGGAMAMLAKRNRLATAVMSTGHRAEISGMRRDERIAVREREVLGESRTLGTEPHFLRLPFYDRNYETGEDDIRAMIELMAELEPDWIFLPQRKDAHPAHLASRAIVLEALRRHAGSREHAPELWAYEGPWALFDKDDFNALVSIPLRAFERKVAAIRCHSSQLARTPYHIAADALARMRSSLVPESSLAGFGKKPPKLEQYIELYATERLS